MCPTKGKGGEGCSLVPWSLGSELCQQGHYYPQMTLGLGQTSKCSLRSQLPSHLGCSVAFRLLSRHNLKGSTRLTSRVLAWALNL